MPLRLLRLLPLLRPPPPLLSLLRLLLPLVTNSLIAGAALGIVGGHYHSADEFAVLRLTPYRLRVMPGTVMTGGGGAVLTWSDDSGRRD